MKKAIAIAAGLILVAFNYYGETTSEENPIEDPFTIPAISTICGDESSAWKIPKSVNLPHAEDIPGFPDTNRMINLLQRKADDLSWRSFIALNWPADEQGNPDPEVCFASTPDAQSVFEFWMPSTEIYVEKGEKARPWKAGSRWFSSRPKNGGQSSEMRIVAKSSEMEINNPESHPVIDKHGHYTLYEIFYNKEAYDYVTSMGLNTLEGQKKFTTNWPDSDPGFLYITKSDSANAVADTVNIQKQFKRAYFPVGSIKDSTPSGKNATYIFSIGEGAIIAKTAWLVLLPEDDISRYHTREVKLEDGSKLTIGLVGMHIVHKVVEATQWVWSSFEHIDNAPQLGDDGKPAPKAGAEYVYYDESKGDQKGVNRVPPPGFQKGLKNREPTQVVTLNKPYPEAIEANKTYHKMIREADPNSVWLNYRMVGTQWPFTPTLFTAGDKYKPKILANSIMETYHQKSSSCMGCHSQAKFGKIDDREGFQYNADFIFGLSSAK